MVEWSEFIQKIVGHLIIYSFSIWNFILGVWLIVRWVNKNWKVKKTFSVVSPAENKTQTIQPVINVDSAQIGKEMLKQQKDMGPVEVDIKKNIIVGEADVSDLSKSSEVKRGKVKTQKDKLKKLRGK
jgi:hypothetical protein